MRYCALVLTLALVSCSGSLQRPATTLEIYRVTDAWHPIRVVAVAATNNEGRFRDLLATGLASQPELEVRDAAWTASTLRDLGELRKAIFHDNRKATLLAPFGVDAVLKMSYGAREDESSHGWRIEVLSTHSGDVVAGMSLNVWQDPGEAQMSPQIPTSGDSERAAVAASELARLLRIAGARTPPN